MNEYPHAAPTDPASFYLDEANSVLDQFIAVFQCRALIDEGRRYMARSVGLLNLCMDATHNFGLQNWKLFCLGFLGVWWHNNGWHVTLLPLGFAIAPGESTEAAKAVCRRKDRAVGLVRRKSLVGEEGRIWPKSCGREETVCWHEL